MRRRIGFLPENPYFYDYLTAEELLDYYAGLSGLRGAERTRRVRAVLDEVGIGAERRMRLRSYSKGMIQRVGVAQALVARARRRVLRRADVRTRSARPPRSAAADAAAARSRMHGVFQLAHPRRCGGAVQPRRHRRAGAPGGAGAARRHRRVRAARMGAGRRRTLPTRSRCADRAARARRSRRCRTIATRWSCRRTTPRGR